MKFAVVIPTKDRPDDLRRILDSIAVQTMLPARIVIVDQSKTKSEINLSELPEEIKVVHIHSDNISGLTSAKNVGIKNCDEPIIHFFDDDIILDLNYFELINNHFDNNPELYGICGRQKNSKSSRFKVAMFELFHQGDFKDIRKRCNSGYENRVLVPTKILPGGITAYRKSVFDEYQFDEVLVKYCLGEDMDFSFRVSKKYQLAFATDVLAIHNHSQIGRYDPIESFACKVAGYEYFYKKNVKKTIRDKCYNFLLKIGTLCDAITYSLKNRNMGAIKGIQKGYKYIRTDFEGVPFIDKRLLEERKNDYFYSDTNI